MINNLPRSCAKSKPVPTVFDTLPNDILFELFAYLSFQDIARLRSTSFHFTLMAAHMIYNQCFGLLQSFNFEDDDIPLLFDCLEYHSCIITGIAALRIVHPQIPLPDRLEILSSGDPRGFVTDLVDKFGFTFVEEGYSAIGACKAFGLRFFGNSSPHFARLEKTMNGGPRKEIVVVGTGDGVSVVGVVTEFPSTLLMNFITGDGFYSLYPTLTSAGQGYLNLPVDVSLASTSVPVLNHLKEQRFVLIADPVDAIGAHQCGVHPYCPSTPRLFPGPPLFLADFHGVRNCRGDGTSLRSVFYTLRSSSACGTELGPSRNTSSDDSGVHITQGNETGTSIELVTDLIV